MASGIMKSFLANHSKSGNQMPRGSLVGSSSTIEPDSLDGTNGFVLNAPNDTTPSGRPRLLVSSAGDVNDDGVDDLLIGAPRANTWVGESYVVFGGAFLGSGGTIDLDSLDGTNGFVLNGIGRGDNSGRGVSSAGDVNGDGIDDLIIGASGADPNGNLSAGESYVVFGRVIPEPTSVCLILLGLAIGIPRSQRR